MVKIIPKVITFLTPYDKTQKNRFPAIVWSHLFELLDEEKVEYLDITFTQVIEWDMAPMRKFFHGVQIPAFEKKYTDGGFHPDEDRHDFCTDEIKTFLKAKFLGFEKDKAYDRWAKVLKLDRPVTDIYTFTDRWSKNLCVDIPVNLRSSESVEPVEYWRMIEAGNKYYFDTFHEIFDVKTMPDKPEERRS